ncbi:glycosyltransferase family 2 protein [Salinicola endophyticus]|uniref:Glycosyltransferase family 2 protein n=1 Tax=Salinicola endophyticus TaxID=1949083 RepID=A0AB74UFJ2_9GAMM
MLRPLTSPPPLTPLPGSWGWLKHTTRLVCQPRLLPLAGLEALTAPGSRYAWRALDDDPQFLWRRQLPLPGWHMLEVRLDHAGASAAVKLYFDTGDGFDEAHSLYLALRAGRVSKRLCYIPPTLRAIRFDPLESTGEFSVEHLRLVWLTPGFAHERLAQRLTNLHPDWLQTPRQQLITSLKRRARERGLAWRELALAQYEATFARTCPSASYRAWLDRHPTPPAVVIAARLAAFDWTPTISILLPTHDTEPAYLTRCLDSVLAQSYPHWQLCIADDASRDPQVMQTLSRYAAADTRIALVQREHNGHICAASNSALELARGEFVALLDHDDELARDALFHVVEALQRQPDAEVLYSDEDKIDERGERFDPHFKPAWNPDLLLGQNYLSHLSVYRTAGVRALGGFRLGLEGSQDHDLALRCTRGLSAERIVHIPQVLYHWRAAGTSTAGAAAAKAYTGVAGLRAVREHLAIEAPAARVEAGRFPNTYRVHWPLPQPAPLVSLLVPTRDRVELLEPCVRALLERTAYPNLELLILDNDSRDPATLDFFTAIAADPRVRVLRWPGPFNYSALNNFGAAQARGTVLGLVNNDIEPMHPEWLTEMVAHACRPEIGCVGAKLYYPNGTIQHAGVVLGVGGVAGHAHKYFSGHQPGYFSRLHLAQNYSAVTAACLVVRREIFTAVGGLDAAHLAVAFNDVDFCLRVRDAGYRNLWTPFAELYHHESVSRGSDDTQAKRARAASEAQYMRRRWGASLFTDPAYHPHLTLTHEDFSLR